jgi:tetratricopeptide (TPR) repeat protein
LIGLKWINEQQNHYKNSDALEWANNIKNELEMIKNTQETISYYPGCSYFNLENPNYIEALKYIELSLENKTDWNVFNKSYVKAVSTYNLNKDLQEAISVLQEADKVAEELKENLDDHCYIKYLLAFSYYYNFKNSQKALEKIKESLSINPYYKNSLELKEEINRRK